MSVCVRVLGAGRAGWGRAQGSKGPNSGARLTLVCTVVWTRGAAFVGAAFGSDAERLYGTALLSFPK